MTPATPQGGITPITPLSFDVCSQLVVRTDWGHGSNPDHKNVSSCECKAMKQGIPCHRRGECISARISSTWSKPSAKGWPWR